MPELEITLRDGRTVTGSRVRRLVLRRRAGRNGRVIERSVVVPRDGSLGAIAFEAMVNACRAIADEVRRTGSPPGPTVRTR